MNNSYIIGIDIGGTNTDATLIDNQSHILFKCKTPTTSPLENGVRTVLQNIIKHKEVIPSAVKGVFVGTTHTTNALLENRDLYKVGVIRIAGHNPDTILPCFGWPQEICQSVFVGCITIDGGYECDGRSITPFVPSQVKEAASKLVEQGAESIAIIGVFSPIISDQETESAKIIQELFGQDFPISLSYHIGGVGFIERENSTILNCALKKPIGQGFRNLERVKSELGINCPLLITQNDGSVIGVQQAVNDPLLTISSGATNSFIGASKLTNLRDAIVVDIGGTSTDIGMVINGYPKRSIHNVRIGGINLNFPIPDVLSLALGGGSYISFDNESRIHIGPKSSGKNIFKEAKLFGGDKLTLSDAAAKIGCFHFSTGNIENVPISQESAHNIIRTATDKIEYCIQRMRGNRQDIPVIAVGGGAPLLENLKGVLLPENADVANAFGAALAEISGTIDTVVNLSNREETLNKLKEEATNIAIKGGADSKKTTIIDVQITPYHYMKNQLARVIIKASGPRHHI